MDAAIAEIIGTDGASLYAGGAPAGITGPLGASGANVGGHFNLSGGGGVGANGTAILLVLVTIGLTWFYIANRGMMR